MKLTTSIVSLLILIGSLSGVAKADAGTQSDAALQATYQDIKSSLGLVPTFFKSYPKEGLTAAWEEMKTLELNPATALPGKDKELIGIAVAAQIPCRYCLYFHTEAAKLNGATAEEISEAIAMAAATRHWSTLLNGVQYDESDFRKEADRAFSFVKDKMDRAAKGEKAKVEAPITVTNAETAYQDIEQTLGSVPNFFRLFPMEAVSGAWKMMKTVQLNPGTALSGKVKELIGLGVSAQVPCKYCAYFHTEAAKQLNGATERETHEAVAMASLTRFWSTVLNGNQTDEMNFRHEVSQIMRFVKAHNAPHELSEQKTSVKRAKK